MNCGAGGCGEGGARILLTFLLRTNFFKRCSVHAYRVLNHYSKSMMFGFFNLCEKWQA